MDTLLTVDREIKTIRELIDRMALEQPEVVFLISPETGRVLTFRGLREQSSLLSIQLRQAGLKRGDKIAFLLDNGLFSVQLFLGAMYGGFVSVPLNVRAGVSQLSYTLDHCDANVVYVSDQYSGLIKDVIAGIRREVQVIPTNVDSFVAEFRTSPPTTPLAAPAPEDAALLMYTSGSTGQPKAAVHSHRTVLAHARNSIRSHQLSPSDRSLLLLPLYHINAECVTLVPTLLSGGSVVVPHGFSVSQFWDWLDEYRCTWSALVPTIISQLLDWKDPRADSREAAFQRIRFLRSSSAPLSPSLHREFLDKFMLLLIQAMGSTEAGNIFSNPLPPGENKIGSPGLPWGFETKIVDREGVEVPPGEPGEVLIRGPAVMHGYYKDPDGTAAVLGLDGWLHTGDLAYRDEDGYFFVVGRSKELIIKGGMNIAPKQIDEVLESHPAVLEAAAVGVPDRYVGEDLVAFVVLRAGMAGDERGLLAFCESRLGHFKTPTRIHFVDDLPKGPSGKVQRLRLLDEVGQPAVARYASSGSTFTMAPGAGQVAHSGLPATASSIEQMIAEIWAELLGEEHVDVHSNFFSLGGHSLLAIQCLSRLRERLPIALSLSDFFENATVAQQAALVRQRLCPDVSTASSGSADGRTDGKIPSGQSAAAWEQALLQQRATPAVSQPIPPRDRARPCPLSPAQQRLWFMEQLDPGLLIYNEAEAVRLQGELNVDAMEQALNVIVARHEMLRTTIQVTNGQPVAVVHSSWPLRLRKIDLSTLAPAQRQAEAARLLIEEPQRAYHLEAEPGIRATLLYLGPDEHVFILTMHHIYCDWSSVGILWRELAELYRAFSRGLSLSLPPLPIQYGDYAAWHQKQIAETNFAEDLAFWEENLRGAPELLELPTDRPRPRTVSYRGARQRFRFDATLAEKLRALSRREKTSLFTVFAAALNTLLFRYTGQQDILVGIPMADRDRPELQSVIGFLLQTHVLRTKLSGEVRFRELLARVQKGVLDLYDHRAVPFDQVVKRVRPERNLSYSPLFQVMINWRDRDQLLSFIGMEGLEVESLLAESRIAKFDVTLCLTDIGDEIWLEIEYSTDLFDAHRIERLASHYRVLLEGIVAEPDQRIGQLPILSEAERHQLLVEWNRKQVDYPSDRCLHELIEEQVERTPDATSVSFEDTRLTYRQLNDRANQLARHLQVLGVGPDVFVGICLERSLEMVVGLLGILKAGGAYVPLDPEYPQERLAFMLEDADVPVLLTQARLVESLPPHQARVIRLDADWPAIAAESPSRVRSTVAAHHLAYMIYTSGSTGKPKGVLIEHGALAQHCLECREFYGLTSNDRLLQFTSFSFDVATEQILAPLISGAQVVLRDRGIWTPLEFQRKLKELGLTVINFPPAYWRQLAQDCATLPEPVSTHQVRLVIIGGEEMPVQTLQLWQQTPWKDVRLLNVYGPTETVITPTSFEVPTDYLAQEPRCRIPIGRPRASRKAYVLDCHGQPVPIGVAGELHLGGKLLARGYHNRPELTGEKFISDPFSSEPAARLYKTGDLARYLPDGNLEYLGRLDQQVKIHGFRVELGEVEAVVSQYPGVRASVVDAREDLPGDRRLVAYIVGQNGGLSITDLRGFLQAKLPDYMVPTAFVVLEALPLSPNGKVDRKALPAPERTSQDLMDTYVPPRTSVEKKLCAIWCEVLRLERAGINDKFFELGGDSILSISIIAKASQVGVKVSVKQIFQYQTIAELAQVVAETAPPTSEQGLVTGEVPLTPIQCWFFEQDFIDPHYWNQAMMLQIRRDLDPALLEKAIQHLAVHHDALRLRFVRDGYRWNQFNAGLEEAPRLSLVDLGGIPEAEQATALESAAAGLNASLDLSKGPQVRAALLNLGAGRPRRLLIIIHHLAVDGISWRSLLDDLETACQQLQRGEAVKLPPKTASFRQWAQRLTEYAHSTALEQELDYWLDVSAADTLPVPVDFHGGENTEASARTVSSVLDVAETRSLLQQVPQAYNTQINDILLSALALALTRWIGQPAIRVNLQGHGREELFPDVDLSRTVGWFTTLFPVRLDLSKADGPGEVLKSVKEQLRRVPNRGIGFGLLRYLNGNDKVAARLGAQPQPQVVFNYLGQFDQTLPATSAFDLVQGSSGPPHSPRAKRSHILAINSQVIGGCLRLDWSYSERLQRRSTIERLADDFLQTLRSLMQHCTAPGAGGYTPSDFAEAGLNQEELDRLISEIGQSTD